MKDNENTLESIAEHFFNPDTAIFYSDRAEWEHEGVQFIAHYSSSESFSLGSTDVLSVISDKKSFILKPTSQRDYSVLGIKKRTRHKPNTPYLGSAFETNISGQKNAIKYISSLFD